MKLARRMKRLGTETAFSVLARAKALEAEDVTSSTSRSANPTSIRRSISSRPVAKPCAKGTPTTPPPPVYQSCGRLSPLMSRVAGAQKSIPNRL